MSVKIQQIISILEELAPKYLAESWDNVGLMVGSPSEETSKVLICLDVNKEVVKEAVENKANLIISHHPLIFSPLKNLRFDNYKTNLIRDIIKNDISVYSSHTNLDISSRGLNNWLAEMFNLENISVLDQINWERLYKIVFFVPKSHIGEVKNALGKAGAGWIGNYSHCTFSTEGIGTFKPLEGTNPYIGSQGKIEEVEEVRIETVVKEKDLSKAVKAAIKVHPYEEVAYDIYPLKNNGQVQGLGVVGELAQEISGVEFIEKVKKTLNIDSIRGSGKVPERVKKVAICTGAGASLMSKAKFAGADVFLTGDIKYHDGQQADEIDLFVIDAGHYATEIIAIDLLANYLEKSFEDKKLDVEIIKSKSNRDYIKLY